MSLKDRTVPVFIYPSELTFYLGTQVTHKQLLTLYNPYEYPVKYQVFSNTTDKYSVVDPSGSIAPKSSVDLLIRHNAPNQTNCHSRDKFMVTMKDAVTNQTLGKRYIIATLLPGEKDGSSVGDDSSHSYSAIESTTNTSRRNQSDSSVKNYLILLSVLFTIVLSMPTKCDEAESPNIPSYLHIAVAAKIIVAYVLGIITMALLKPF